MKSYHPKQTVRITTPTKFADSAGVPVDPTSITLTVKRRNGDATVYTYPPVGVIQRVAAGDYYADIEGDPGGTWSYWWDGVIGGKHDTFQGSMRVLVSTGT